MPLKASLGLGLSLHSAPTRRQLASLLPAVGHMENKLGVGSNVFVDEQLVF